MVVPSQIVLRWHSGKGISLYLRVTVRYMFASLVLGGEHDFHSAIFLAQNAACGVKWNELCKRDI